MFCHSFQYIFEWKLDDKIIVKAKNSKPQRFQNVQVGVGRSGENGKLQGKTAPANAIIRNLDYTSKGNAIDIDI